MGRKSISQRLSAAKSPDTKAEIKAEWAAAWESETMQVFARLERAIQRNDFDELCISAGQLKAVLQKHFTALPNVLKSGENVPSVDPPEPLGSAEEPCKSQKVIPLMPEGYITLREWSIKNGKSPRRGQRILVEQPNVVPAIKVRNPRGGVDIWAVPENTPWPF
jgi:hypothetical protein